MLHFREDNLADRLTAILEGKPNMCLVEDNNNSLPSKFHAGIPKQNINSPEKLVQQRQIHATSIIHTASLSPGCSEKLA